MTTFFSKWDSNFCTAPKSKICTALQRLQNSGELNYLDEQKRIASRDLGLFLSAHRDGLRVLQDRQLGVAAGEAGAAARQGVAPLFRRGRQRGQLGPGAAASPVEVHP